MVLMLGELRGLSDIWRVISWKFFPEHSRRSHTHQTPVNPHQVIQWKKSEDGSDCVAVLGTLRGQKDQAHLELNNTRLDDTGTTQE